VTVYDTLIHSGDTVQAGEFLVQRFLPVLQEFWDVRGGAWYRAERFSPAMAGGVFGMLASKSLLLVYAAEESGELSGFILGGLLRQLLCDRAHLHIEAWYGRTPEIEEGLFAFLGQGVGFMPEIKDVLLPRYVGKELPKSLLGAFPVDHGDKLFNERGI
jgi:hypothetical protein